MSKHPQNYGRPPVRSVVSGLSRSDEINDPDLPPFERTHVLGIITPAFLVNPAPLFKPVRDVATITIEDMSVYMSTRWNRVQKFLGALYGEAAQAAAACGRPDLNITFFFEGSHRGPKQPAGSYDSVCGDEDNEGRVEGTFVPRGKQDNGYNHPMFLKDSEECRIVYNDGDDYERLVGAYSNHRAYSGLERMHYQYNGVSIPWVESFRGMKEPKFLPWENENLNESWVYELPGKTREEVAALVPRDEGYDAKDQKTYDVVALGGTFDHLHAGHKVLLTMGIFLAAKKLIIGVSSDELLKHKAHAELIEPLEDRIESVRDFVLSFNRYLEYEIVPINDVYGPTATDANIQALVLSTESFEGGEMVAKERKRAGLPPLKTFSVDVVHSKSDSKDLAPTDVATLKDLKMGSSHIRAWLAAGGRKEFPEAVERHKKYLETMDKVKRALRKERNDKEAKERAEEAKEEVSGEASELNEPGAKREAEVQRESSIKKDKLDLIT